MKPVPWRVQLGIAVAGYVAVVLVAAVLVYFRYLQYLKYPDDAASSGGMYAFGDWMLALFIGGLFLIPTFLLVLIIRQSESAYTSYSQILVALSLTAPICLAVLLIPAVNQLNSLFTEACLYRFLVSPLIVVGLTVSRLLARFDRSKRLTSYALSLEVVTLAALLALFLFSAGMRRG